MKSIFKILLIIMVLNIFGCTKDDTAPDITPNEESVEGVYIGTSHQINKGADQQGYYEYDTTYADTFTVSIVTNDTILFANKGREWKFSVDTNHYYLEWYGTHSNRMFRIRASDSLYVNYWRWGGFGSVFDKINRNFKGVRQ